MINWPEIRWVMEIKEKLTTIKQWARDNPLSALWSALAVALQLLLGTALGGVIFLDL